MKLYIAIILSFISSSVYAGDTQNEIEHLLSYIENSACSFERNGRVHTGKEAVRHIRNKFDYYKDEINNAEKFIELSASKSKLSGRYYMIKCGNSEKMKNQKWLLEELMEYRKLKNVEMKTNSKK